jgi:predicted  nucleic acid-binding Zn-ribbon protein
MEDVLQKLANLQYIDSRIDELKQLRGDLPEDILDIETDINRQEAKISKLEQEQTDLQVEKDNLDLEIKDAENKLEKYEDQQISVRNNREYDALTKEIKAQKQVIENSISRKEEIEKREEEIEPEIEAVKEDLEKIEKLHAAKKEELDQVIENTDSEEKKLLDTREELEEELDERYLRSYKRLREGLTNGLAVVPMEKGAAIGMQLPPQMQVEVRRKNKIIIDESSGRIVLDPSFFEKAEEKLSV